MPLISPRPHRVPISMRFRPDILDIINLRREELVTQTGVECTLTAVCEGIIKDWSKMRPRKG